jgi:hypothetical protein
MAPSDWEALWVLDYDDDYGDDYGLIEDPRFSGSWVRSSGDP